MDWLKIFVIYFLVVYFSLTTSIMLHEQIHVFQVKHRYHTDPLEVCYLGTDKTGYGWVTFEVPANESNLNASRDEMEALSVQIIYGLSLIHI